MDGAYPRFVTRADAVRALALPSLPAGSRRPAPERGGDSGCSCRGGRLRRGGARRRVLADARDPCRPAGGVVAPGGSTLASLRPRARPEDWPPVPGWQPVLSGGHTLATGRPRRPGVDAEPGNHATRVGWPTAPEPVPPAPGHLGVLSVPWERPHRMPPGEAAYHSVQKVLVCCAGDGFVHSLALRRTRRWLDSWREESHVLVRQGAP